MGTLYDLYMIPNFWVFSQGRVGLGVLGTTFPFKRTPSMILKLSSSQMSGHFSYQSKSGIIPWESRPLPIFVGLMVCRNKPFLRTYLDPEGYGTSCWKIYRWWFILLDFFDLFYRGDHPIIIWEMCCFFNMSKHLTNKLGGGLKPFFVYCLPAEMTPFDEHSLQIAGFNHQLANACWPSVGVLQMYGGSTSYNGPLPLQSKDKVVSHFMFL